MNQQPDKLFRERLENFELKVSSNAWSRVDANINKKNKGALWLKIAASLLLIAVSTFVILSRTSTKTDVVKVAENDAAKNAPPASPPAVAELQTDKKIKTDLKKSPTRKAKHNKTHPKSAILSTSDTPPAQQQEAVQVSETSNTVADAQPSVNENTTEIVLAETQPAKQSRVSIVITAAEADEKYLDKNSLADATPDEKKTSTLKKLIDTAYDLKNNQDPFGDLRQKKNEILALNFKSEKQRSQNK